MGDNISLLVCLGGDLERLTAVKEWSADLQKTSEIDEHQAVEAAHNLERKRAESALNESEARYRIFFEHNADAMLLLHPQTLRYIDANEAAARLVGATITQILDNASPTERWPERQPDGRLSIEKAREMVELALTRGSHRYEWYSRRCDGSDLPLDIVMTPVPFREGVLLCLICREIGAQKRTENEIRQLNASLEKRVSERTTDLVRSNDKLKLAEENLRKRSDQLQKHQDALLELAHSDKSNPDKALQMICSLSAVTLNVARVSYWSVREGESAISCEVLYLRETESFDQQAQGNRLGFADYPAYFEELADNRPVVANHVLEHPATSLLAENYLKSFGVSSLLDAPVWRCGEAIGVLRHEHIGSPRNWTPEEIDFVIALASMVTLALEESHRAHSEKLLRESEARLRESEARFSTAFRTNPGIMTISRLRDEKYIEVNDAFVRWYGFDREEIIGHDTKELDTWVNPEDRAKFWADLRRDGWIREVECQFRTRWGTKGTVLVSAEIIEINGEPHVLAFGIDITQRKQAEVELLRALAKEKELGQLRSHFVSMISHEFRTPLGIIQSSAEILDDYLEQLEPDERKDHLRSICRNTRRMAGLMEEALLLGSFDAGKMEFRPAPLQLHTFLHRLVDEVLSATNRRCPIELSFINMPAVIRADERLLQHIFTNLLANAVKYSGPEQAVRFEIESQGPEIVWAVRDQGIGIPQADQEWLFNAFHRGQNVADRPGTGLGLVIVKRCVDLHGGKIRVESQLGKGTSMIVRLPK